MYKIIFFLNLFFSLIFLGVQLDTNERNRFNAPLSQVIPSELLENILKFNEKATTAKSKRCEKNKNIQFRVSDQDEQKWMPLLKVTAKPIQFTNKVDDIKLDYSQSQKLTFLNKSDNPNPEQNREIQEIQTTSNILLQESRNNEPIIELEDDNLKYLKAKGNEEQAETKNGTIHDDNDLGPITLRKGHLNTQSHSDNNKSSVNKEQLKVTQVPYLTTRLLTTAKRSKDNVGKSISKEVFVINNEDDEDDISFSSESNESDNDNDTGESVITEPIIKNKENEANENDFTEYTDKSNDLNMIRKHFESRNGMKMTELSDSDVLLMKSHRICYSCISFNDPSCLKPNRQTTVKYCHGSNTACVTKSYTIASSAHIIRDCGSSCLLSDKNEIAIKYETCSICHYDLCNSSYSINVFIAPLIILAITVNKIVS